MKEKKTLHSTMIRLILSRKFMILRLCLTLHSTMIRLIPVSCYLQCIRSSLAHVAVYPGFHQVPDGLAMVLVFMSD